MSPSVEMIPSLSQFGAAPLGTLPGAVNSATSSGQPLLAAVTVDFDASVFLQMALFGLLVVVLKPLLFDPMLKVFALREERTDGAKAEAREMQEKAAEILRNYEKEVAKVKADATSERDQLRRETAAAEAEFLAKARAAAEQIGQDGQGTIETELAALQKELDQKAAEISVQIASKVLGREVSA